MRRIGPVLLAAAALGGCGDADGEANVPSEQPPVTTTTTVTVTEGIDPLDGAGTNPVSGRPTGEGIALLEAVTLGRHEGFDRIVFRFRNHVPGHRVRYAEGPFSEDGSGNPVVIEGDAFIEVRMEQASGFDLETGEGELVYKGPKRLRGADAGTSVIRQAVRTGDFEALLTWIVGLSDRVDFRVLTLAEPPRLVIDLRNH
jgi:hypothetical protein